MTTPPLDRVLEFARYVPPDRVRVVIVGQDPYPQPGDADGLAFSVSRPGDGDPHERRPALPASLRNIFAALVASGLMTKQAAAAHSGSLAGWARQGVLLLNMALVLPRQHRERSLPSERKERKSLWALSAAIVRDVVRARGPEDRPVFILWGRHAQRLTRMLGTEGVPAENVLTWTHPSPLSRAPFAPCDNFTRANALLLARGHPPIDWAA